MLGRGLVGLARQPLRALRSVPTALPNLTDVPGANAFPGVPALSRVVTGARRALGGPQDPGILEITTARPPRTCFNGPISSHRSVSIGSVSLDTVKAIKDNAGVKVNDVVVAVCAGAVREFLLERGELPDEPLVAMVPVSVRGEDEQGTFGNRISTMIVPIPTDVADPKRRLERAHELLRSAKEHHAALPADLLTDATSFIPPAVAALAARTTVGILGRTRPPLNLVISNVPGPRSPLYIAGARLESHYPVSAVVDGVGLNMTVMSYLDHLDFGIVADRDQIADVWPLLEAAQHAVDELAAAIGGGVAPVPSRA
jgi:WS/DGAT/MGAT family acyltransferase